MKFQSILNKPFFTTKKYIIAIWFLIAIVSSLKNYFSGNPYRFNNYLIYKGVFFHAINQLSLYDLYPAEFFDRNHYGPIFSLIIAPFALLPDWLGMTLWSVFNTSVLVFAINQLPLKYNQINIILWLCAHEFLTTILSFQFNPIMTAIIILSYVFIIKKQDFWAAMVITLGLFVKLYGIVGLAFFFFSKNKLKFIISILFWSILFFVLPMLITSPEYICQTYIQWLERLVSKNTENASLYSMQDISFMGMFRRIFNSPQWSNLPFLAFGLLLFGMQYWKLNFYTNLKFQLLLLSSVLIFTVIFSSGSESPTYIIAFLGVAIWFVIQEKPISNATFFLLIFAIILTSLSPSDLIPKFIRQDYIRPYALKAFPCVIIWFRIVYEIIFLKKPENRNVISV
jgi:hypothetical protein